MKKWFNNAKISVKITGGFLIVALIAGIIGGTGLISINFLSKNTELLFNHNLLGIQYTGDAATYYQRLRYNMAEMLMLDDVSKKDEYVSKYNKFIDEIDTNLNSYGETVDGDQDQAIYDEVKKEWGEYRGYMEQAISYAQSGDYVQVRKVLLGDADATGSKLQDSLSKLVEFNKTYAQHQSDSTDKLGLISKSVMAAGILISILLSLLIGRSVAMGLSKRIRKIVDVYTEISKGNKQANVSDESRDELGQMAELIRQVNDQEDIIIGDLIRNLVKISEGDLRIQTEAEYPGDFAAIKEAIEHTAAALNQTMYTINITADQVSTGADQVSGGAQALASGSTEQAASVEELSASIETVAEQAMESLSTVSVASEVVSQAGIDLRIGNEHMKHLTQAIEEIGSSSSQIANITKVIEDIAFQTNILALNAAIEAARAGAAGKGFAVVADEVRNLAAKSAEAAKQTGELIQSSVSIVERGTQITAETAKVLESVASTSESLISSFAKIEQFSREQADAIGQIRDGLSQVSAVVQTNAATAEENSATSEEMSAQVATLRGEVERFKLKDMKQDTFSDISISKELPKYQMPSYENEFQMGKY